MGAEFGVVQCDALIVVPEIARIIIVRMTLAVVAKETIKPLLERVALRAGESQTPLTHRRRDVALPLEQFAPRDGRSRNRRIALGLNFAVIANPRVDVCPS